MKQKPQPLVTVVGHLLAVLETMHKYTPVLAAGEDLKAARAAFDAHHLEAEMEHPEDAPIGDPPPAPEPVKEPEPEPDAKAAKGKR